MKRVLLLIALTAALIAPALAQSPPWDNLRVLGQTPPLIDETGASITLAGLRTKYDEAVVGMSLVKDGTEVRFYMNAKTWDSLKQFFIMARDQWQTLHPDQFTPVGSVKGYKIANRLGTLSISLQGATQLSKKRLMLAASGGADKPTRATVAMKAENLDDFVESLYKVDEYLRKP